MALSIPLAILVDRKGKKIFIIFGMQITSSGLVGLSIADNFLWLAIFAIINSIGMAIFEPAALGLIASVIPPKRLSTVMGIYGGIFENTGIFAGSALAGIIWDS